MARTVIFPGLLGLLLAGCELILNDKAVSDDSATGDDDGGSGDGGSGSGGGSNGGGAGSGDGGSGSGGDALCEEEISPESYDDGCITAELSCGGELTSTIAGGTTLLDGGEYSSFWACEVVGTSTYGGAERMYSFVHPGTGDVTVRLDTPCVDLDLFVMHWEDAGDCPRPGVSIGECDGDISGGNSGAITVWNNESWRYVVVVESESGEEGNFGLSLSCP